MADPFAALRRIPVEPVQPDADFKSRLRLRIEHALRGAPMTTQTERFTNGTRQGDVGYISFEVPDIQKAVEFFGHVLGWTFSPNRGEQGRRVDDVAPMTGMWGGQARGEPIIAWRVDDIDSAIERVRASGGQAAAPERNLGYGSTASCQDDQGTRFYLWQPTPEQAALEANVADRAQHGSRPGDIAYLTLQVQDSARARAFYGSVLGWQFTPGPYPDGFQINDTMPMTGMSGGHAQALVIPMYRVEDINASVEKVLARGGTSTEVKRQPYGLTAECTDDQGTRFYLGQL